MCRNLAKRGRVEEKEEDSYDFVDMESEEDITEDKDEDIVEHVDYTAEDDEDYVEVDM